MPTLDQLVPERVVARLGPERTRTALQFGRFGVVGTAGFLVDTAALYAAIALGAGLYGGRAISYVVAATTTGRLTAPGRSAAVARDRRSGNGRCSSS
jgi:hypothetical protein